VCSQDFRQITIKSEAQKAERLFRAAVSAFCSLTRPSRREIAQLEDLALPLFEFVSVESKRYVAAALSECAYPPAALIRRLCDESVDIAAPLLIRSTALSDIDLITLIGRHGYGHARAIGRRPGLNPTIARLVTVLENKVVPLRPAVRDAETPAGIEPQLETVSEAARDRDPGATVDDVRRQLRAMMRPASAAASGRTAYDRLRDAALSGHSAIFQTALADALDTQFAAIQNKADDPSYAWLLDALSVLGVSEEKAFLVAAAIYPASFGELPAIRLFLSRYAAIDREQARARIAGWKSPASETRETSPAQSPAHSPMSGAKTAIAQRRI
jgi:uncharacterized protein (DUF2336 family)